MMATATQTTPGTPKLSEVARRVHAPSGIVSTGWPSVEAKCGELGISFRWWQPAIGRLVLAKRADGMYASTVGGTGLSIPRQVGKTFLVAAIMFALCLLRPGFTVLWTAHRLKTAEETFGKLQVFAKRRKIAPHVRQVKTGSGEQQIIFRNGSRILFGARERGFGRGFDEVDALVFDEAQHMTDSSLDDMIPATNQSRQPEGALMLFMGTPPRPQDPGEVFARMRADAEAGDEDTGWVEFGAEDDYTPTPLPAPLTDADWGQISSANPSFPEDTSRTAILRMRKKLGDASFLREGLGIWGRKQAADSRLNAELWDALADPLAERGTPVFALDVDTTRHAQIGVAWQRPDGDTQVMLSPKHVDLPAHEAPSVCKELTVEWGGEVLLGGAAAGLVTDLEALQVPHRLMKAGDFATASGLFLDAVTAGSVQHGNQPELNASVIGAEWRRRGVANELELDLTRSETPGPLAAVIRAYFGLKTSIAAPPNIW